MHRLLAVAVVGSFLVAGAVTQAAQSSGRPTAVARATPAARPPTPSVLPGTRPGVFATIQGNAVNSTNGALSDKVVRLRDARVGRIADVQTTDKSGLFIFRPVDPGNYIVELIGDDDQGVVAASQMLSANAGEVVTTVVKLPFSIPAFAGFLGQTSQPAAAAASAVMAVAAASGILGTVSGVGVSPE
jgi:hypothetical protein